MRDPQLLQLLGPDMKVAPQVVQQTKEQVQNYTLEHLLLRLNQEEDVPAYFAYPSSQQPVPLVLFNHSHGGDFTRGKEELRQSPCYMQKESLFATFMKLGVAVGVIDMWGFGERKNGENDSYKRFLLQGKTLQSTVFDLSCFPQRSETFRYRHIGTFYGRLDELVVGSAR